MQPQYPQYPTTATAPYPYPPQQYAPPAPPLPTGTLDTFYGQPSSGGGPAWKFMDGMSRQPLIGKTYAGIVARPLTDADVRAQTDQSGRPATYRDGRPKFVMVVPMLVQASPEFPEGVAGWWCKGQARDELARAMAEAGAPAGPPEAGAGIRVTLVGVRPVPGMNPAYQYRVEYMRPGTQVPVPPQAQAAVQPAYGTAQAPVALTNPTGGSTVPVPMSAPAPQPAPTGFYGPTEAERQPAQQPAQQPVPTGAPVAVPVGFNEEQAALFARLTGQSTG